MSSPKTPETATSGDMEGQGSVRGESVMGNEILLPPKGHRLFGVTVPAYRSPMVQIVVVGFILFLNPGMYNALTGLGGAGQVDATVQNRAAIGLHVMFAIVGFLVGIANNRIGTKWTMAIGGIGYAVYSAAFLCYNHTKNQGFVIFSGCLLGFCAAFLWCAQGVVMMSYPTESEKGRAVAVTWLLFNLGSVLGSAITLGQNWAVTAGHVTDGTYAAFIVLEALGAVLCCFLVSSGKVVRSDGTRVQKVVHPNLKSDMLGLWTVLRTDPWVLLLFPMFFASNYFYTYQFNDVNAYYFSTRTRAFNNLFYWIAQIIAAAIFGWFMDWTRLSRRTRALAAWVILFVLVNVIWGGGVAFLQKTHRGKKGPSMDIFDHDYFWYLLMYMCYGFLDALWQTYSYYTMGAMSNDPRKLAYYAGFYKSIQAAGAAIISALDANKYPFANLFASSWALMAGGLLCALPVYLFRIRDTEITDADREGVVTGEVDANGAVVGAETEKHIPLATGPMGVMGASGEAAELGDFAETK